MADVKMPKLGESVTEGTLGKWLKQVGDRVEQYEPLVEVVTDKVNAEIPSDFTGTLTAILVGENETVRVGTVIASIAEDGAQATEATVAPAVIAAPPTASAVASARALVGQSPAHGRYSPLVLKLAAEHQVDLATVTGTGMGGRVTRKDVLAYVASRSERVVEVAAASLVTTTDNVSAAKIDGAPAREEWIAVTPIRKTIATRMVESKREAPHAWTMMEVDATNLVRVREQHKAAFREREGIELTYLPFFIKAVIAAIKEFPIINSTWAGDKIIVKKDIHISIAVATADALVVPVLHNADQLNTLGLARGMAELAARARAQQLRMEDVEGGTFTVNNTGAFGSVLSQPILNAPQAAIMTVEAIVKRPVVQKDDSIAIRSMVNLCLSIDHRVLDGWVAGQFLRAVKAQIERGDVVAGVY